MYFEYGLDADLFWMMSEILLSRSNIVLECVSAVNYFLLVMSVFSFNLLKLYEGIEGAEEVSVVL